jgi:hypothetical protein
MGDPAHLAADDDSVPFAAEALVLGVLAGACSVAAMDPMAGVLTTNPASFRKSLRDICPDPSLFSCSPDLSFSSDIFPLILQSWLNYGIIFQIKSYYPHVPGKNKLSDRSGQNIPSAIMLDS